MILAAIDIGSNAVRLQITNVIRYGDATTFKRLQFIRFPLRLGSDVFTHKKIGEAKFNDFIKLMSSFKTMIDLYKVDEYFACATSAMRESENGEELVKAVKENCDLNISIISGDEEADMINRVISFHITEGTYLHIDVGGGSTELNIYQHSQKLGSRSFPMGSVRVLTDKARRSAWDQLYDWLDANLPKDEEVLAIGTGGNINKLFELVAGVKGEFMSMKKMEDCLKELKKMDYEERMHKLQMNADRADVIIPASGIYINTMKKAGANKILVPDVGLKDGIMTYLYEKNVSKKGHFSFKN